MKDFLWDDSCEGKNDHLISWEAVCLSRVRVVSLWGTLGPRLLRCLENCYGDFHWSVILYGMLLLKVNIGFRQWMGLLRG